ncbi:hypothetical protein C8R46DRAFT_1358417 [Mycena filopes]|nr:hypothetical protein C8R46DRAFT_1358417 [Mycena filopes]
MDNIIVNDDEEDQQLLNWDPSQWISRGKVYRDVPAIVEAARRRILRIPASFTANLPPKSLSITQLLEFPFPPIDTTSDRMDDDTARYSDEEPTRDIEEMLAFILVPTRSDLRHFLTEFGQAWFDGKKSLRTSINPGIAFPFWVLSYWAEILDASEARECWSEAASWLQSVGRTEEELNQKHVVQSLWSAMGWHGNVRGFAGVSVSDLAKFFSTEYLGGNLVDAMLDILSIRLKAVPHRSGTLIVNTTFASFVNLLRPRKDGTTAIEAHPGAQKYLRKYGTWFRSPDHTQLYLVLHRPPDHWTACTIDFEHSQIHYGDGLRWERPKDFFLALNAWTTENFPEQEFQVADDLPCALQTDGYNCPMISVNAVAHSALGDPLWTGETADTLRMKAFCELVEHALSLKPTSESKNTAVDPEDFIANVLAANPDINDTFIQTNGIASTVENPARAIVPAQKKTASEAAPTRGEKRKAESDDGDERKRKAAKPSALSGPTVPHPFFASNAVKPQPPSKSKKNKKSASAESSSLVGISRSATAARNQRAAIRAGTFQPTASKTKNFRETCREIDPTLSDASFEETCKQVQCSICRKWVKMQDAYCTSRYKKHFTAKTCTAPRPKTPADPKARTLDSFALIPTRPKAKHPPPSPTVQRPCPGLTRAFDEAVGNYLDRTTSSGGGAHSPGHYSSKIFGKPFLDLTAKEKETVYTARFHDYAWRNDVSPGIMACFAAGGTGCLKIVDMPPTATTREAAPSENLKFVPRINQNAHAGMLFAKFKGLDGLLSEDNEFSLERRYFQHVINGDFKDDKVFNGIIQAKVMAKDREIKGVGMQNFKHNSDLDAVLGLIHTISPRAHRELAKHIPARTERSIKHVVSKTPRFPIGIVDETFVYATQYLKDYNYPLGGPLSLSVDDTKLFPALRPLYDGVKQRWYIVGTTGEHIVVPNAEALHATLDELESTAELATKLRLWVLQIPLPGVPPLVVAITPIGSKVKGPELADWQIQLMEGLVSRGFRITSSGGDGASVERDCQRRTASASKLLEVRIKHPDPDYPDIVVQLWDLDGNVWVVIQDAKHGRKTFRNNAFSGARTLTLGNFLVFFQQIHTLGMKPNTPLYRRDFINSDRMDDPAAARFFSADFLEQAAEEPAENLGLVIYLLVFGDFIDAWQSRSLSHHERAKIAIRTHLFLETWRLFLAKAGYSEARHFISKEAFDIAQILINGLLGLIIIHRDHLGAHPCPLLPWFNASEPNEHCFSGMRDINADFSMQQAILIIPKLRAKMQASVRVPKNQSDFKKQASGYCHTYYSSENIDYNLLSQYPTDIELSAAYEMAGQENECLWSLLGIHPGRIRSASPRRVVAAPLPDPAFQHLYLAAEEADASELPEKTAAEELQGMIDSLKTTANLSRAADEELDACVLASAALSMDELARIEDLPESDPQRFAEIQQDIAHAMSTQPTAFMALLQGMADSAVKNVSSSSRAPDAPPLPMPPVLLIDVSSTDLTPFVEQRRRHQTEEARTGVRTYKSAGTYRNHKTGVVKPLSDRQVLAQRMQAIIRHDQQRGSSTGLNRNVRWKDQAPNTIGFGTSTTKPKAGNAANAELAATGRSKEAIRRRRTIFAKLKCSSIVAESGIGPDAAHTMETGCYGFALTGSSITLVQVRTMYSRSGGKTGGHSWAETCETIGSLSFVVAQVFEHEYRRHFKIIHNADAHLGILRFGHLPVGSFLALLPKDEGVKTFQTHVEIGFRAYKLFEEILSEKEGLARGVASLNTVRRKGKADIHILELPEDDCVE